MRNHWQSCALTIWLISCGMAHATLPIDLEVAFQPGITPTAPQQWAALLGRMDLGRVRIRAMQRDERPLLTEIESPAGPRYKLLVILSRRNELVVPGRRFRSSDQAQLRAYFARLPQATADLKTKRGRFGLTEKQFRILFTELARPTDFSTTGKSLAEVLDEVSSRISVPVVRDSSVERVLRRRDPQQVELRDLSLGVVLTSSLRREGLVLVPEQPSGGSLQLRVTKIDQQIDFWPTGWPFDESPRQVVPALYQSTAVEISGYTLSEALQALQSRLKIPVLFDQRILKLRQIDPNQIQVQVPSKKTYLKRVIDRILSQARLVGQLRVDEAGNPFLWVTQLGEENLSNTRDQQDRE